MTKYEQVLRAVQAACPDTYSCSDFHTGGNGFPHTPCGWCGRRRDEVSEKADPRIRLSHVLRAIGKTNNAVTVNVFGHMQVASPSVSSDGLTIEWKGCDYDLTKDDFSLQSEETINLLFDILCK